MPLTLAAGIIASVSVSASPASLGAEQREQLRLLAVVRAGGIAERGPDAAEALARSARSLGSCSSGAYHSRRATLVQLLGERLGEAVGERLDHDRVVVVVLGLEARGELVGAEAGGDRERADGGRLPGAT